MTNIERKPWRISRRTLLRSAAIGAAGLVGTAIGLSSRGHKDAPASSEATTRQLNPNETNSQSESSNASLVTGSTEANSAVVDSNANVQTETKGNEGNTPEVQSTIGLDFELKTIDGKAIKLSDFRGKPVILSFWAPDSVSSVGPEYMVDEIGPNFPEVQRIGVIFGSDEEAQVFMEGAESHLGKIDFPVVFTPFFSEDYKKMIGEFQVRGTPDYAIVSSTGEFVGVFYPGINSNEEITALLEKAASEN